jgi:putative PIN family toxin of toxin-antitoxin system
MKLVIDTNIIVSALLSPNGSAFRVLSDVLDGKYVVFVSEEIFREYEEVLYRDKFGFEEEIVAYILEWFKSNAIWVEVTKSAFAIPDEKDRIFFDVAKSCHARLITGNNKHYPVDELVTSLWEIKQK